MEIKMSAVILVFSSVGKLALQLRSKTDDSYPSHWDFSAAGGLDFGEEHGVAASRELYEEIGIKSDLTFVFETTFKDNFCEDKLFVYKTISDGPFFPDPKEVDDIQFFSKQEIDVMIESGSKFHPEFIFLWKEKLQEEFSS